MCFYHKNRLLHPPLVAKELQSAGTEREGRVFLCSFHFRSLFSKRGDSFEKLFAPFPRHRQGLKFPPPPLPPSALDSINVKFSPVWPPFHASNSIAYTRFQYRNTTVSLCILDLGNFSNPTRACARKKSRQVAIARNGTPVHASNCLSARVRQPCVEATCPSRATTRSEPSDWLRGLRSNRGKVRFDTLSWLTLG
ncbi:hypothetical protein CDAR_316231 [Caerostris darwini]|uniref:Uncharacterized protein n=1 Tax=Caerostris darwini TaxID=1538125 RepID=A0AAV4QEQ5_9ARAC|nr:hypothetical protein CDAR_316231 [Caerostris darwini]